MDVIILKWLIGCFLSGMIVVAGGIVVFTSELGNHSANVFLFTMLMFFVGIWFYMKYENSK